MSKRQRELVEMVEAEGLAVVSVGVNWGAHCQMCVRAPDGRSRKFNTSLTPSDRKGSLNFRADIRKFVRGVR